METRLRLILRNQQLLLALKSVVFGALLLFYGLHGGLVRELIFFIGAFFLYVSPIFRTSGLFFSFLALSLSAALLIVKVPESLFLGSVLGFTLLFYLLLALKALFLVRRAAWEYFLVLALLYVMFLTFFSSSLAESFFMSSIALTLGVLFIVKEFLKKGTVVPLIIALLLIEAVWVINMLPLGFLNAANLGLLFSFVILDISRSYFQNSLQIRQVLVDITVFILLLILIFSTISWGV